MKKVPLLLLLIFIPSLTIASTFPDVAETNPHFFAIQNLQEKGIIQGNPDGTFQPNEAINRAAVLKILLESANIAYEDDDGLGNNYPDVPKNEWYSKIVSKASTLGIVKGNSDGTFEPSRAVNKAELLKMIFLTYNLQPGDFQLTSDLAGDVKVDDWYAPYINYAFKTSVIRPNSNHLFQPDQQLSRGEVAEIMYAFLIVQETGITQSLLTRVQNNITTTFRLIEADLFEAAIASAGEAQYACAQALKRQSNKVLVQDACKLTEALLKSSEARLELFNYNCSVAKEKANEALTILSGIQQSEENESGPIADTQSIAQSVIARCGK